MRTNEPLCILKDAVKSRGAESGRIPNCCANFWSWALLDRNDRASLDPYSDRGCRPIFVYQTGLSWKNIHHYLAFSTAPRLLWCRASVDLEHVPAVTTIPTSPKFQRCVYLSISSKFQSPVTSDTPQTSPGSKSLRCQVRFLSRFEPLDLFGSGPFKNPPNSNASRAA